MDTTTSRRQFITALSVAGAAAAIATGKTALGEEAAAQAVALGDAAVNISQEVEVLVIGAGLSGMMAAWEIASAGHEVLIVDQNGFYGGDAIYSAACMMVSTAQLTQEERPEKYMSADDIRERFAPYYEGNEAGLDKVVMQQEWGGKWLDLMHYDWGYDFQPKMEGPYQQAFFPRDGICTMYTLFEVIDQKVQQAGATYLFDTTLQTLLVDGEGMVCGARFLNKAGEIVDIAAGIVVLATGGYVSNQEWMTEYAPEHADLGNIVSGRKGDGIKAGLAAGGTLAGMTAPGNLNPRYEAGHMLGVHYPMLGLLPNGRRFYCETAVHNAATGALANGYHEWYTIFDDVAMNGVDQELLKHAQEAINVANTFEELAEGTGIHPEYLQAAFDDWKAVCDGGEDPFGRTLFLQELQPPYYWIRNVPVRYKSCGGLNVSMRFEVLDADGDPIPNLYACGCTAGTEDIVPAAASGMIVGTTVVEDLA